MGLAKGGVLIGGSFGSLAQLYCNRPVLTPESKDPWEKCWELSILLVLLQVFAEQVRHTGFPGENFGPAIVGDKGDAAWIDGRSLQKEILCWKAAVSTLGCGDPGSNPFGLRWFFGALEMQLHLYFLPAPQTGKDSCYSL